MIRRSVSRVRRAGLFTALAVLLGSAPAFAQVETLTEDFATLQSKFSSLAEAMGEDTYDWRPMEGVRSVSEVYMLIAAEAYYMPSFWDADPPEGIEVDNQIFGSLAQVTDKAEVLEHLAAALAYCADAMGTLTTDQLDTMIQFFGQERSMGAAVFLLLTDMHEHLGQAIAYARSNEVVPPWSDGG